MTRKKDQEEWITGREASELLTANSGHTVSAAYVRLLAKQGKIRSRPINGREKEYKLSDLQEYKVVAYKRGSTPPDDEKPIVETESGDEKPIVEVSYRPLRRSKV